MSPARRPSLLTLLRRDLARYRETSRAGRLRIALESLVFKAGFQAVLLYRLSSSAHHLGLTYAAWLVSRINQALTGAEIEFSAEIGPGLLIAHPSGIVIGRGTVIGEHATIFQGVTCGIRSTAPDRPREYPHVGNRVILYAGATLIGDVRVGDWAIVGAHALVTRDVPDGGRAEAPVAVIHDGRLEPGEKVVTFEVRRRIRA
jgi:serine O-acetyltransferase